MKILIVDDNETFLSQIKKYLTLKNFDVDVAYRGKDALRMLVKGYDAVLLDLKIPDISGIEIMKEARRKGIKTNFIVITGYGEVESAVEAMKLGAVDYIQKPFDTGRLLEILNKIKSRKKYHPFVDFLRNYIGSDTLLISENPEKIRNEYGLDVEKNLRLSDKSIEEILSHVEKLVKKNGFIIHTGIKLLNEKGILKNYLMKLQKLADEKNIKIVFICESVEEKRLLDAIYKGEVKNVEKMIEIFKSPVRRKILHFIMMHGSLKYSEIMKLLDVKYSSKIAFHLKKLHEMNLVEKVNRKYKLTPEGEYMTKIFDALVMEKDKISYFVL